MPYIANPLEGLPIRNSFITDQSNLGTTPASDDTLIIYDISATALKQLTITNLQASILASPTFTGTPTAPTANAGTSTTQLATTAFVTTATTALNTITEMTDVTISSIGSGEVLKWNGSAWINQELAEANILTVAGPTFTGVLTVGSAVLSEADLEQIDDLTAGTAVASKALVVDSNKDIGTLRNLTIDGTFSDGNYTFDTSGNVSGLGTIGSGAITSSGVITGLTIEATGDTAASDNAAIGYTSAEGLILTGQGSTNDITIKNDADATVMSIPTGTTGVTFAGTVGSGAITSTGVVTGTGFTIGSAVINEAELETIDGITAGTAAASKALVLDSNKDIGTIRNLTIDGVFTDGNYTFATDGNVTGLGTVASGTHTIGSLVVAAASITDTSGAISFGDENLTTTGVVTAGGITLGSAVLIESELEMLDGITAGTALASKALVVDSNKDIGTIRNLTIDGTFSDGNYTFATDGSVTGLGAITSTGVVTATGFTIGSAVISESELEMIDGITAGTAAASKALVLDASTNITGIGTISAGAITSSGVITGTAFTAGSAVLTEAELEVLDAVTPGTAIASKVVTTDGNIDTTGQRNLTISGELDAATGDFSGAVDIAGALTLSGGDMDVSDQNMSGIKTATFNSLVNGGSASSGTIALNWANGLKQYVTLSGNVTITMAAPAGPCNVMLKIIHSGTGRAVTWSDGVATIYWPAGAAPTLSSSAGTDIVAFFFDGTAFYGQASVAFA